VVHTTLTAVREKHVAKCEKLDVLRVELAELQSKPTLLRAYTSCPGLHDQIVELHSHIVSLEADLKALSLPLALHVNCMM
jgi:hypothetical protein